MTLTVDTAEWQPQLQVAGRAHPAADVRMVMVKQLLWLLVGFPSVNNTGLWRAPVLVVDNPTPAVSDDSAYMSPPPKNNLQGAHLCVHECAVRVLVLC
jgi:hypothetical protein